MDLFSEDIEFLKELYYRDQVEIYFFHEKYMLSPAQLARTIRKFEAEGIIVINDSTISVTTKGKKWIFAKRKELFLGQRTKYWKTIPLEMKQFKIDINEPYKPRSSNLDPEIYKKTEDGN